jgi:hypothetical protein
VGAPLFPGQLNSMLRRLSSLRHVINVPSNCLASHINPFLLNSQKILRTGGIPSRFFSFRAPGDYDRVSNKTLDRLFEDLEILNDSGMSSTGYDIEYSVSPFLPVVILNRVFRMEF